MKSLTPASQNQRRRQILEIRRRLDPEKIEEKSTAIAQQVAQSDAFKKAKTVGL